MTFEELNLKRKIKDAVKKAGYIEPSPVQAQSIPIVMKGYDLIACAQTGTGKTAAFALPILSKIENIKPKSIRALVLTPTRELAIQIFENFKMYGRYLPLRTACIYGGARQNSQILALKKGIDILVATPGRLIDFMNQKIITLDNIEIFVLDEADRMLDMGFIGDVRKIESKMPKTRQTIMFSATMPKKIEELAREILMNPKSVNIKPEIKAADNVNQHICFTEKDNKICILSDILREKSMDNAIVFTRTKRGADRLVKDLNRNEIISVAIHGDKTQGQRQQALQRFKSGQVNVLVATDVASRGIDVPKLGYVINYDLPVEAESYIHRIGRTGRAGESGEALTICTSDEMALLFEIEKLIGQEIPELETPWSIKIDRIIPIKKSRRVQRQINKRIRYREMKQYDKDDSFEKISTFKPHYTDERKSTKRIKNTKNLQNKKDIGRNNSEDKYKSRTEKNHKNNGLNMSLNKKKGTEKRKMEHKKKSGERQNYKPKNNNFKQKNNKTTKNRNMKFNVS